MAAQGRKDHRNQGTETDDRNQASGQTEESRGY